MTWIVSNAGTIFVIAVLLIVVSFIVKSLIRKKKTGESYCTGNCANCQSGQCRSS